MTEEIETLKTFLRSYLPINLQLVPAKTEASKKDHLEVWRTLSGLRTVGLEMHHKTLVNFWMYKGHVPSNLPESIQVVFKDPDGQKWTGADGKGANSNLSAYDEFRRKRLVRMGVTSVGDAKMILETLS